MKKIDLSEYADFIAYKSDEILITFPQHCLDKYQFLNCLKSCGFEYIDELESDIEIILTLTYSEGNKSMLASLCHAVDQAEIEKSALNMMSVYYDSNYHTNLVAVGTGQMPARSVPVGVNGCLR